MDLDERHERFRALYESTRPRIIAYATRRTSSFDDAAEVVAETFAVAWRRVDDIPEGEACLLWLYAVARRVNANSNRRTRRRVDLIEQIGAELRTALPPHTSGITEDGMAAMAAFRQLGDGDQEILMLAGWEGLNSVQLGCVLGCSPTAARIRLFRARSKLTAELAESESRTKHEVRRGHKYQQGADTTKATGEA